MSEQPDFDGTADRLTYLITESQQLLGTLIVVTGVLMAWFEPDVPSVPAWIQSSLTAAAILTPPLWISAMQIVDWLRSRNNITVYHINAIDDEREKYLVPPELWEEKTIEGPSPHPVNGGAAWEVREFHYDEDSGELTVAGTWMSETSDSELLTSKAMLEDVHGTLIDKALQLSKLRARVKRMGVEIQEATVMELVEMEERGTMLDDTAVKDAFDSAAGRDDEDDEENVLEEIQMPDQPEQIDQSEVAADGGKNE